MARKSKQLPTKEKIFILCEGYTEVHYLEHLNQKFNSSNVIVDVNKSKKTDAVGIVESAISHVRRDSLSKSYVFIDKDHNTLENLQDAYRLARDHNITISFSNVSFDLWILLHYRKVNSWLEQRIICKELTSFMKCSDYSRDFKNNRDIGETIFPRIFNAFDNIKVGPHYSNKLFSSFDLNPYSNITDVLEEIYKISSFEKKYT